MSTSSASTVASAVAAAAETGAVVATTTTTTATKPNTVAPKKKRIIRRKKLLTPKQKLIKESAEQRFKIEKLVFVWQEKLFTQAKTPAATVQRAALYLQPKTFEEVVEERAVQSWCGYPLCDNEPKAQDLQKYKISLKQRKVYDQSALANYCSEACYHKAKYYIMQLSEEPVWFRDLNALPTAHIILLEEDFKTAIKQERKRTLLLKSSDEIRSEYVQHLLANVPKDTKDKFEIIEKSTVAPPSLPTKGDTVFDSIEGYRIEIKKNDGRSPTTMVLKKKSEAEIQSEKAKKKAEEDEIKLVQQQQALEAADDPDAMFETMMMLKDMHMDRDETPVQKPAPAPQQQPEPVPAVATPKLKPVTTPSEKKNMVENKTSPEEPTSSKKLTSKKTVTENINKEEENKVIQVKTKTKKAAVKKKATVPELSLFGTIWTILDHMTTKATRVYLHELHTNHRRVDIATLLQENDLTDDSAYLRGHIFSERILDTYGIVRTQLNIRENMEDDIVNVIKTFRLSDASMVALNPAQCYMMTLVLIKSLADILLDGSDWKKQFEMCCKTVDQSIDTVDACVRVLKIASV
ncbi:hypothetical protein INT47_008097 [Mucor saturninus]|uniref:RNA polymerase II subunit B1 CTD phosphatase RPAP2 homolog n=1 Tax=Mucor saturninus TaxID=64648 RepID=A0A8H7R232_9FUNG|nr:hypothetical protein INT47_008097 [Mucor saturninus]